MIHNRWSWLIHRSAAQRTIRVSPHHPLDVSAYEEVTSLLRASGGLVVRRDHPQLVGSFDWLLREGRLVTVLPGVYAPPEIAGSWQTRARALGRRHPNAVLVGAAAARISFWPAAPLDHIEAASRSALKPQPGFAFNRRHIPAGLIAQHDCVRYTVPALTAIDMATFECSDAIDIALRVRATTLAGMYEALRLTPHRAGNQERLRLLIDHGANLGRLPSA
jgi:hypothetical protein